MLNSTVAERDDCTEADAVVLKQCWFAIFDDLKQNNHRS